MKKALAAKVALLVSITATLGVINPASAVLPVTDVANLTQNYTIAVENVAQTLKQIEQYRLQLKQYENMITNTLAPAAYIWDLTTNTITQLHNTIDTLKDYKTNLRNLDDYLAKFKNAATYRSSPCYSSTGCSDEEWAAMKRSEDLGSESQKKATDAAFRGLDLQQDAMKSDARQLERLQSQAAGASGQMEALAAANQLASHQANQLLQIRALLIAQQNVLATRDQALADREAKEAAAGEQFRKGTYRASPVRTW